MADAQLRRRLDDIQPKSLKVGVLSGPKKVGEPESRSEIGQAFEWALEQAHVAKQDAAYRMGYSEQSVISQWVSGRERVQMDKVRLCGQRVWQEFLIALLQLDGGVEVKTQVLVSRVG